MDTVLICGGAGYIGSHTVLSMLRAQKYHVVVYDNFSTGYRGSIERIRSKLGFQVDVEEGSVGDKERLRQVFSKYKNIVAVMHFCALIVVPDSVKDPLSYYENNVVGTLNLLQVMQQFNCNKFIFSSTAAVFGDVKESVVHSDAPCIPVNPYGETKLVVERMLDWLANANENFRFVALRYFNACGADESGEIGEAHHPESHLIPLVLQVPLGQRDHIKIFGTDYPTEDGTCIRDYIHINDLASAHILALEYLDTHKSLKCNLGSGKGYSVRQVIEACRKVTNHPIPAQEAPRREGDPPCLVASSETAERELKWVRKYDNIEAIVASAWKWHKNNPNGYK